MELPETASSFAPMAKLPDPLVSICIPTYRGAAFIAATIESVLNQSYRHFELLVVDDGSQDATIDIAESFDDSRVRVFRSDRNRGPEGNWNRCQELASGTYYKLLPQDDLLEPESLAEQVAVLEQDRDERIALVFGARLIIDHRGKPMFRRGPPASQVGIMRGPALIRRCIRAGTNVIGEPGNGLMRRSLVTRVGPYDARHPYMVDLDFWFRALAHGEAFYTGSPSSRFRISRGSWSVALGRAQLADFQGFASRYAATPGYHIERSDLRLGFAKARLNTLGRSLIYKSILRK